MYQLLNITRVSSSEYPFKMEVLYDDGYFQEHYIVFLNYKKSKNVCYFDSNITVNGEISNITLNHFDELRKWIKMYMSKNI
jgi:hypothetical protein